MRALALALLALPLLSFNYPIGSPVSYSSSDTVRNYCTYFDSSGCMREFWAVDVVTTKTSVDCLNGDAPYETKGGYSYGGCPANGTEVEYDERPIYYADSPTQ